MSGSADDRFREMFFEEARELLISLEEGLMDLERRQSDRAHLDKTFRAAHSLKGAAAMVGLGSLAEFTHHIEAVLERIRAGLLAVDSDIITTLLEARDHLAAMVEAEAARSPIPASGELTQRLISLLRGPSPGTPGDNGGSAPGRAGPLLAPPPAQAGPTASLPPPAAAAAAPAGQPQPEPPPKGRTKPGSEAPEGKTKPRAPRKKTQKMGPPTFDPASTVPHDTYAGKDGSEKNTYRVTLTPGPDVLRRGINPLGVLDELRDLGETTIATDPEQVPPLEKLDPERCYLSWTITVKTDANPERLGEAFLFFAEDSTAAIQILGPDGKWLPVRLGRRRRPPAVGGGTPASDRQEAGATDRRTDCGPRVGPRPDQRVDSGSANASRIDVFPGSSTRSRHDCPGAAEAARPDPSRCHSAR